VASAHSPSDRDRQLQELRSALTAARAEPGQMPALCESIAAWVGGLFTDPYTPAGELPWFEVEGQTGARVGAKDLLPELDDYLPLLAACGHRAFALEQGAIVRRTLVGGRLIANPDPGLLPWITRSNPFYYTDLILGLLACHRLGLGGWWLETARDQVDTVLRRFSAHGLLVKEVHPGSGLKLPVSESNSLGLAEILVELGQLTGDHGYVATAERLVGPWLEVAEREGAVPQLLILNPALALVPRFAARRRRALLYKHNLMFLNALWALAGGEARWKDVATRCSERVCEHFAGPDGVLHYVVVQERGRRHHLRPTLKCTLLAELLCDVAVALGREGYLTRAAELVEPWLAARHPLTGLIPYDLDGRASDVDALTDFAVTLLKLHAANRQPAYASAARDLMAAIIVHHGAPYGLVRAVDVTTGQRLDHHVETRHVSLALKPWLLLPHAADLYARRDLLTLVRDR